jgi:hypothetical protein
MILLNGREIFQRREKNQRQRGTTKRPTSGNRREGSEKELTLRATGDMQPKRAAHKICGTDERGTSGLARMT